MMMFFLYKEKENCLHQEEMKEQAIKKLKLEIEQLKLRNLQENELYDREITVLRDGLEGQRRENEGLMRDISELKKKTEKKLQILH